MQRSRKEQLKRWVPRSAVSLYHRLRLGLVDAKFLLHRLTDRGNGLSCNFCGYQGGRFLPDGELFEVLQTYRVVSAGRRPNSLCPACRSKDRERLILFYLKKFTSLFDQPMTVLHIAPEQRLRHKLKSMSNVQYINADLDPRHADVQMDITAIPHADNHFDLVICNHVLEHIPDDRLAMRELFRVLKPGGQAILQVPIGLTLEQTIEDPSITDPAEREVRFGQFDHVRIYGQDYSDRLAEAGFEVQVHDPQQFVGEELIQRHALIGEEMVYVGTK